MTVAGARHTFEDPISGQQRVLVMGNKDSVPYDGTHGVEHLGCDRLANVSPELDAFYCSACQTGGRISGAWFMDLWMAVADA